MFSTDAQGLIFNTVFSFQNPVKEKLEHCPWNILKSGPKLVGALSLSWAFIKKCDIPQRWVVSCYFGSVGALRDRRLSGIRKGLSGG